MELLDGGIAEMRAALEAREVSARELVEGYRERVGRLDRDGPRLRAVIELNPDAERLADASDRRLAAGRGRGPLEGIPVMLKDNIDTGDRMATTAGSLALEGHRAPADAAVAARLRAAGAVILGKTNLSEWANFRSDRGCSGWSSRGGLTRNPYALDRSASGSSSGSAVAAAAALCAAAVGTETDGSIVSPASATGVVGFKPTVGVVSRAGIIPVAASQDTAGPLTRSVADAALLLAAMAGPDPDDPATAAAPEGGAFLRGALRPEALRGARLGVARDYFGRHEEAAALIEGALRVLHELGAEIVDGVELGRDRIQSAPEMELMVMEIKLGVDAYLAAHPAAGVRSLAEVVAFNREHAERVLPYFGQERLERAVAGGDVDEATHLRVAAATRGAARAAIDGALGRYRLDALVAPTLAPAWVSDLIDGDLKLGSCAAPAAMAGYPHLSVPAGTIHGLPVGLSLFAEAHSEARLFGYAYAFERASQARRPPTFPAHAGAAAQAAAARAGVPR